PARAVPPAGRPGAPSSPRGDRLQSPAAGRGNEVRTRTPARGSAMGQGTGTRPGPLGGVTVLDTTRLIAGPYCAMLLGDLGADVVKVEPPGRGEDGRHLGPPFVGGESAYFLAFNRNKRSVTLDLKRPGGAAAFLRLAGRADVLLENFRPGTMERLGLGYEALRERFPRLIYCAISGFGA